METTKTVLPTLDRILSLLDDKYYLTYIDYNDNLNDNSEMLQRFLTDGNSDSYYDDNDALYDYKHDSVIEIIKDLKNSIQNEYELTDEEIDNLYKKYEDDIYDAIYDRDNSEPLRDLLNNTSSQVIFYDTGFEVPEIDYYDSSDKEVKKTRIEIKKHLKLKTNVWDKDIEDMIKDASYGGKLVVYFQKDIEDFFVDDTDNDYKQIKFINPVMAIIDIYNGSGGDCSLDGAKFTLPFERSNLFLDKSIKYNYTYAVCGMGSDWCDATNIELKTKPLKGNVQIIDSDISMNINKDKEYNKVFKSGGCSIGDMDMSRHRKITYINNYPCGSRCNDCGTFWVD